MSNGMFRLCIEHEIIASTYLLLICPRETSAYQDVIIRSLCALDKREREDVARV